MNEAEKLKFLEKLMSQRVDEIMNKARAELAELEVRNNDET